MSSRGVRTTKTDQQHRTYSPSYFHFENEIEQKKQQEI